MIYGKGVPIRWMYPFIDFVYSSKTLIPRTLTEGTN